MNKSPSVLVVYASNYGSTGEIAHFVGHQISQKNLVEIKPVEEVKDLSAYRQIIVGGPIYAGRWSKDIRRFFDKFSQQLKEKDLFFFLVGLTLRSNQIPPETSQSYSFLLEKYPFLKPLEIGYFAGASDQLPWLWRKFLKWFLKIPSGDFRDFQKIEKWTEKVMQRI